MPSSLSTLTGNALSTLSEEYPAPKSSMEHFIPARRNSCTAELNSATLSKKMLSVNSNSNRPSGMAYRDFILMYRSTKSGVWNCIRDTLTDRGRGSIPASSHWRNRPHTDVNMN